MRPETLIRWHRKGFSLLWASKCGKNPGGRPAISEETKKLIKQMSSANRLWGAPRIQGALAKLGIRVSISTIQRYMLPRGEDPSQKWETFLNNHSKEMVAIDLFAVPTIRFRMLWSLVVLSPDRRKIVHVGVTYNPTSEWTAQQMREAFPYAELPRFVLRDRGSNLNGLDALGTTDILIAPGCPWQNGLVERVIGSIRRECTDGLHHRYSRRAA